MAYKFLDHTADIAVEVIADTLEELFTSAASAWREAVVDLTGEGVERKTIHINESTQEELLVSFLAELNYLLFSKRWLFSSVKSISLETAEGLWHINSHISGEKLDNSKHHIKEEIKAVTFHQMYIQKKEGQYSTRIIFDI